MTEWEIVSNTVIRPYKAKLLRVFNTILKEAGFEFTLVIHSKSPVSTATLIDPKEVLTINEQRMLLGFEQIEGNDVLLNRTKTQENG